MAAQLEQEAVRIREAIASALADVNASNVASEDRAVVLRAVLDARLETGRTNQAGAPDRPVTPPAAVEDSDVLGKMALAMKVERSLLELVYDVQDGKPTVVLSGKKLPDNKSNAAKVLAQLVVGARQAAGLEEWTGIAEVRSVVNDYGRLDSGNFAGSIQQLDSVYLFRGKGTARELKVTRPGMEEIAGLITTLAGS